MEGTHRYPTDQEFLSLSLGKARRIFAGLTLRPENGSLDPGPVELGQEEIIRELEQLLEKGLSLSREKIYYIVSSVVLNIGQCQDSGVIGRFYPLVRKYSVIFETGTSLNLDALSIYKEYIHFSARAGDGEMARALMEKAIKVHSLEEIEKADRYQKDENSNAQLDYAHQFVRVAGILGRFAHYPWAQDLVEQGLHLLFLGEKGGTPPSQEIPGANFIMDFLQEVSVFGSLNHKNLGLVFIPIILKAIPKMEPIKAGVALGVLGNILLKARHTNWYKQPMEAVKSQIEELGEKETLAALSYFCSTDFRELPEDQEKMELTRWIKLLTERLPEKYQSSILSGLEEEKQTIQ
jgi:hypothetical protein